MKLYRGIQLQAILKEYPVSIAEIGNKQRKIMDYMWAFEHSKTPELDK